MRLRHQESREAVLRGFTIKNGTHTDFEGAGIDVFSSSPTITGNIITSNEGWVDGGGIGVVFGGPLIDSNTISQNTTYGFGHGGGIDLYGMPAAPPLAQITNNTITGNSRVVYGGGVSLYGSGVVLVENNVIADNTAGYGGGIYVSTIGSVATIEQNLITGNYGFNGSGIYTQTPVQIINNTLANNQSRTDGVITGEGFAGQGLIENNIIVTTGTENGLLCNPMYHSGAPVVRFNDVFSSQGADTAYAGDCTGLSGTNGNISDDPLFVSPTDFHLLADSPAIDAGDNSAPNLPELDLDGNPRIVDGHGTGTPIIDMGVYEFQPCDGASKSRK